MYPVPASSTVELPGQKVVFPEIVGVGAIPLVVVTDAEPEHPELFLTVTPYTPATLTLIVLVVAPVVQA